MARRRRAEKRVVLPDAKFNSIVLTKFINVIMEDGKKAVAEKIVYDALDQIAVKTKKEALMVFNDAVGNVKPYLEVRSRRVGGATYQVPVDVRPDRAQALAMRWVAKSAGRRSERTMTDRLAGEIIDAANGRGSAVKKREDTHKMADANKAFSHYRW